MKDYFISTHLEEILFEIVNKLDDEMKGVSDTNRLFRMRIAIAEAYNKTIKENTYIFYDRINPNSFKIEPENSVNLSDTIDCQFSKDHSQGCGCFGRGYVTIRMLSDQGIIEYIKDEKKQNDYFLLKQGRELPIKTPKKTNWIKGYPLLTTSPQTSTEAQKQ